MYRCQFDPRPYPRLQAEARQPLIIIVHGALRVGMNRCFMLSLVRPLTKPMSGVQLNGVGHRLALSGFGTLIGQCTRWRT